MLVDGKNVFNKIDRVRMLWTARHLWLSGTCFVFNCYRHWSSLVLRNMNGTAIFLHIKESVTQGDHIAMIVYRIGILPLVKNLKREIPDVTQPWYADDYGALGTFTKVETYFDLLTRQGPEQKYYPEPSKSILIMHMGNGGS